MKKKIIAIVSLIVALTLAGFVYFKFFFVFGEGVKAGELNFVVYKGYVFKTYEVHFCRGKNPYDHHHPRDGVTPLSCPNVCSNLPSFLPFATPPQNGALYTSKSVRVSPRNR